MAPVLTSLKVQYVISEKCFWCLKSQKKKKKKKKTLPKDHAAILNLP